MHDYIDFSAKKKSILSFSGNRHTFLWFTMYPAKLKAHSEFTDVAGIHRYFFCKFRQQRQSMATLFPPLKGVVILNKLKYSILNIVIAIKLSYRDISKYCTYCPGLIDTGCCGSNHPPMMPRE